MWRFSTKCCYVGRTPGMFETVGPGFLRFSPCRAKELQTDIQTISTSERASEPDGPEMIGCDFPLLPSAELRNLWPLVEKNAASEEGVILGKVYPDVCVQKQTQDSLPGQNHTSHGTLRKPHSFSGYALKTTSSSTKHTHFCVCVL